jgi:hypothetical protein
MYNSFLPSYSGIRSVGSLHLADYFLLCRYLNYATGYEALKGVYGYDEWQLAKLRAVKTKWDPEGRLTTIILFIKEYL